MATAPPLGEPFLSGIWGNPTACYDVVETGGFVDVEEDRLIR